MPYFHFRAHASQPRDAGQPENAAQPEEACSGDDDFAEATLRRHKSVRRRERCHIFGGAESGNRVKGKDSSPEGA